MSRIVIDSSVTLAWFFDDERTDAAASVLTAVAESGALVPSLWRLEVANALQMAIRRRRIDAAFRDATLVDLRALDITVDTETDSRAWSDTLAASTRWQLTTYDAAYLELAARQKLPLATLDKPMRNAASAAGITLLGL